MALGLVALPSCGGIPPRTSPPEWSVWAFRPMSGAMIDAASAGSCGLAIPMRTSSEWQTIELTALDHRMARLRYSEPLGSRKMGADGTGKTCDACGLPTSMAGIEYEVDMADRRTFR